MGIECLNNKISRIEVDHFDFRGRKTLVEQYRTKIDATTMRLCNNKIENDLRCVDAYRR